MASAAFMARMDVGNFFPVTGDVIPFNNALLNVGQHYDDQTSVFTCAESGLYLFSVTLYSNSELITVVKVDMFRTYTKDKIYLKPVILCFYR